MTRFGGAGIDIAAAATSELLAAGILREYLVDSTPNVEGTTRQVTDNAELAALMHSDGVEETMDDGTGPMRHPMCTLENSLWYSHRRSYLTRREREGRMLALIVMH